MTEVQEIATAALDKESGENQNKLTVWPEAKARWPETKEALRQKWTKEREALKEKRAQARFDTTRRFVDLRLKELDAAESTIGAIDNFIDKPSWAGVGEAYARFGELQDATIKGQENQIENLVIQGWLLRFWMLV